MRADFFISACVNLGLISQNTLLPIALYVVYAYIWADLKPDTFFNGIAVAALVTGILDTFPSDKKKPYIPSLVITAFMSFILDIVGPTFFATNKELIPLVIIITIWDLIWLSRWEHIAVKQFILFSIRMMPANTDVPFYTCLTVSGAMLIYYKYKK